MGQTQAQATLHTLVNADGSATYTAPHESHKIIAGVNYPVDVPRRSDELPESTFIEVNLRPHNGVGTVKERHVESLVKRTLQAIVLVEETPRTMLQVTLQITGMESDDSLPGGTKEGGQGETYLDVLVGAVNAAVLGCLDAGVRMKQIAAAVLVGIGRDGSLIAFPTVTQRKKCKSLHVFALTRIGRMILMESEGVCVMEEWEAAQEMAATLVLGNDGGKEGDSSMMGMIRQAVEARVVRDERWREE